ncbi:ZYRO0G05632p [Zygosaccharomyces rouxii]|uniref:ZYRO0G05632p n=1 Tax=Zygosaccharomyces rouxii (strain ATCC 2623 / CBS 732 / NBRC 1130 / NCYC 568 / NRRL Y-229) TaxID=559307 RepID=C5DZM4_ZYGRC|nr:uncharacterized protein ZYRO0G05632g [Zygosaccharomyces rouxii]KAH9202305.1 hypothetical protein LQ764DRAFT_207292 [Zygosaccharomyces rouxii]CAR29308.1 ZYRO0G05632p [Zygosaccharomyces rouxii]
MPSLARSIQSETSRSIKSDEMPHLADEGNEFLQVIDGEPAKPPPYQAVNPNRRVCFPVYEYEETRSLPPSYKPTVEECTVVSVKWEWSTPYELSPVKHWHNYLLEINSTQLNFYDIDPELTQGIKNYSNGSDEAQHSHYRFSLSKGGAYQFNRSDQENITARLQRNKPKFLHPSKLCKSFSLQCAKVGVPTDYTKKTFLLRLRCEQEQFMVNFAHVDDMIMWSVYLQTGIHVSLDLDLREYPSYRVVPRRRRTRASNGGRSSSGSGGGSRSSTRFPRPEGPQRSQSMGKLLLSASPSSTRGSGSGSPTPTSGSRIKPQRSTSSGLLPTLHKRHTSSGSFPQVPSNASHSRKVSPGASNITGEESPHSIKSKFKHLFKNEDPPKLVSSRSSGNLSTLHKEPRIKSSPPKRPPLNSNDTKTKFHVGDLNSVQEDVETENQNMSESKTSPMHHSVLQRPTARRMVSSPLLSVPGQSLDMRSPASSARASPTSTPTPPNESISPLPRTPTQREAEEVQQVRREHNDPVSADFHAGIRASLADDDDEEGELEDTELISSRNSRGSRNSGGSIYLEEGIFPENDDDYVYTRRPQQSPRGKCGSSGKWNPPIKEPSRGRYIRDSLRCIKSLNDDDKWMGKVVFRPYRPPDFPTNNLPLPYGLTPNIPNRHTKINPWETVDYKRTRNHYLRPYIVGPTGLVKASTKPHNMYEEV